MRPCRMLLLLIASVALAADLSPERKALIDQMVAEGKVQPLTASEIFSSTIRGDHFAEWLVSRLTDKELLASYAELTSMNSEQQVGASSANKDSTSLAMKGGVPRLLGFAVEHGALDESVNGTAVTFRATPASLIRLLENRDLVSSLGLTSTSKTVPAAAVSYRRPWYEGASFSITFDTSRGDTPNTLLANRQQISAWSARWEIANQRDTRRREYHTRFQAAADHHAARFAPKVMAFGDALDKWLSPNPGRCTTGWPGSKPWFNDLKTRICKEVDDPLRTGKLTQDQAAKKFTEILTEAMPQLDDLELPASVQTTLADYITELVAIGQELRDIQKFAEKGRLITVDWTVTRDTKVPDISTVTGIWQESTGKSRKQDLTINVSGSFFNSQKTSPTITATTPVQRFRDFKLTGQYDVPLGAVPKVGSFVLSFAGRYERIPETTVAPAAVASVMDIATTTPSGSGTAVAAIQKGNIGVGQVKLTIPVSTGVNVPLSITFANRTELVTEKTHVGANFGVTLDLDTIFAKLASK